MGKVTIIQDYRWATPPSSLLWIWLAGMILLLAGGATWFYFRRRKKLAENVVAQKPPAHETAFAALERLLSLLTEDSYMEFVIAISGVLRIYIHDRFEIRAPHRATEEFLAEAAEDQRIEPTHRSMLADFLYRCDLVKFARRHVLLAQMRALHQAARAFVEETKFQPEPDHHELKV